MLELADVVHANNVLAHVADTNGFIQGIRILLKDEGLAVIEVPYIKDLIDYCEFDTIYHEHLCYFSVTALDYLFRQNELYLNDIERLPIHGGSLRLYVARKENVQESVQGLLTQEQELAVDKYQYYEGFGDKVQNIRRQMRKLLQRLSISPGLITCLDEEDGVNEISSISIVRISMDYTMELL